MGEKGNKYSTNNWRKLPHGAFIYTSRESKFVLNCGTVNI